MQNFNQKKKKKEHSLWIASYDVLQVTVQNRSLEDSSFLFDVNFSSEAFLNKWHKIKTGWLEGPCKQNE